MRVLAEFKRIPQEQLKRLENLQYPEISPEELLRVNQEFAEFLKKPSSETGFVCFYSSEFDEAEDPSNRLEPIIPGARESGQ
jgi:hypothetical protein